MSKKEKEQSQEIAVMVESGVPAQMDNFLSVEELLADAGAGSQNVTSNDLSTPIISILQANSPQCKRSDGKYIAGAAEGMLYNNVTQEVMDAEKGILVIPAYFEKVYIEWLPNRGGLVAIHPANTPLIETVKEAVNEDGKKIIVLPNGNLFSETNQHYVLLVKEDGTFEPAVIAMVSTGLRASRMWNTMIKRVMIKDSKGNLFNPASYYNMYKLTTKARAKDQYTWFTWNIEPAGTVPSKSLYEAAKAFEKAVSAGSVKIKHEESETVVAEVVDEDGEM